MISTPFRLLRKIILIKASQCEIEDRASFILGVLTEITNLMVKDEDSDLKVKSFHTLQLKKLISF